MTQDAALIQRVGEAIWRAQAPDEATHRTWNDCLYPKFYRLSAEAAIAAIKETHGIEEGASLAYIESVAAELNPEYREVFDAMYAQRVEGL